MALFPSDHHYTFTATHKTSPHSCIAKHRIASSFNKLFKYTSLNLVPNAQVCVYLTIHITKLQLQTTFPKPLYIPHSACIHQVPNVCTTCDVWHSNIQLTMVKDWKSGPAMPFLDSDTCAERGWGIYFCQGFLPCMMPSMDGWRDRWMDGWRDRWMDGWKKLLDQTTFTTCNCVL
jgi:hypothetical protein